MQQCQSKPDLQTFSARSHYVPNILQIHNTHKFAQRLAFNRSYGGHLTPRHSTRHDTTRHNVIIVMVILMILLMAIRHRVLSRLACLVSPCCLSGLALPSPVWPRPPWPSPLMFSPDSFHVGKDLTISILLLGDQRPRALIHDFTCTCLVFYVNAPSKYSSSCLLTSLSLYSCLLASLRSVFCSHNCLLAWVASVRSFLILSRSWLDAALTNFT